MLLSNVVPFSTQNKQFPGALQLYKIICWDREEGSQIKKKTVFMKKKMYFDQKWTYSLFESAHKAGYNQAQANEHNEEGGEEQEHLEQN